MQALSKKLTLAFLVTAHLAVAHGESEVSQDITAAPAPTCAATMLAASRKNFEFDRASGRYVFQLTKSPRLNSVMTRVILKTLGVTNLNGIAGRFMNDAPEDPFFTRLSRAYDMKIEENEAFAAGLARIPKKGPVMITMNHPLNGSEAIALAAEVAKVRPDVKVLLTYLLKDFPGMNEAAIFLNPYGTPDATKYNKAVVAEQIVPHLKAGGAIMIFPSGEVSRKPDPARAPFEPRWKIGTAQFLEEVPETKILPVQFLEEASRPFYRANNRGLGRGRVAKFYRSIQPLMHLKEISKNAGRSIEVSIGHPIDGGKLLARFKTENGIDYKEVMRFLKAVTFTLRDRAESTRDDRPLEPLWAPANEAAHQAAVASELRAADANPLQGKGGVNVALVPGAQGESPLFTELGRARERVFRAVGEGSGRPIDLDENDPHYHHLIAQDAKSGALLGAYRMGRMDLLKAKNHAAYNTTFFDYAPAFAAELDKKGLELGRSFIDKAAGKKALMAFYGLWQGIGSFIANNPHYRYLVGPMSISNEYSATAKNVMVAYLRRDHGGEAGLATAKVPYREPLTPDETELLSSIHSLDDLRSTVLALDGKDIPPLIGLYLSMGSRFLDFSVDKDFNTIDGMVILDLHQLTAHPELRREAAKYLTEDGLTRYLQANP